MASGIIETIANVSLPAPGVVQHDYTDAPLSPQVNRSPGILLLSHTIAHFTGPSFVLLGQ